MSLQVSSYFIMSHLNQVITWIIMNPTQKGGSKYRVHQGYGCIWRRYPFYTFLLFFLAIFLFRVRFTKSKVMKTQRIKTLDVSSYFIMSHLNQVSTWIILNPTQKGGSKYRVHQGYGCIWRRCLFYTFMLILFDWMMSLKSILFIENSSGFCISIQHISYLQVKKNKLMEKTCFIKMSEVLSIVLRTSEVLSTFWGSKYRILIFFEKFWGSKYSSATINDICMYLSVKHVFWVCG